MEYSYRTGRTARSSRRSGPRPPVLILFLVLAALLFFIIICIGVLLNIPASSGQTPDAESTSSPDMQTGIPKPTDIPDGYTLQVMTQQEMGMGDLILVNNSHACTLPDGDGLVSVYDHMNGPYFVRDTEVLLSDRVIPQLDAMMEGFHAATGQSFMNITSGYRSSEDQQRIYEQNAARYGEDHTRTFVAQPGCSEHQTGLAFDLNIYYADTGDCNEFENVPESSWILAHAYEYGFVQRYEADKSDITGISNEPWHFRYVGPVHAGLMHENRMCLEEYVDYLRDYDFFGDHLTYSQGGKTYEIYFCAGTNVYLPENAAYSLSGNNVDGFIVTVGI